MPGSRNETDVSDTVEQKAILKSTGTSGIVRIYNPERCFIIGSEVCVYLCLVGLVDTSSSLRQASSSCANVLGGGRGGIAGSWMNGWAGW